MIEEFRNAFLNRYREVEEIKRQGKKVIGWTCIYIPEEVIYAAGIIPVRILAGAEETPLGDSYMYANTCSMVRS